MSGWQEEAPGLFGSDDFIFSLKDFDFSKIFWKLHYLKIKTDVLECFQSFFSNFTPIENEYFVVGFCKRMQAIGFSLYVNDKNKYVISEIGIPNEENFKKIFCDEF